MREGVRQRWGIAIEPGELLAIVNLAGLAILGFVGWTGIKTAKQQVLELVNRDLAEVRHQLRTSMKGLDRVRDHVAGNLEDILKIEVNIARIQDEWEAMSRKLERFLEKQGEKGKSAEDGVESEVVPDDERRHIYD